MKCLTFCSIAAILIMAVHPLYSADTYPKLDKNNLLQDNLRALIVRLDGQFCFGEKEWDQIIAGVIHAARENNIQGFREVLPLMRYLNPEHKQAVRYILKTTGRFAHYMDQLN